MTDTPSNQTILKYFAHHALRYPLLFWGMYLSAPLALLTNEFLPTLMVASILNRLANGDFVPGQLWESFGVDIVTVVAVAAFGGVVVWRINMYCNWKLEGLVTKDIHQ